MAAARRYLIDVFQEAYAAFIAVGYLRIAGGGAEVGAHLTDHRLVDEVHVSGSQATHDAIVFGSGAQAARGGFNCNASQVVVLAAGWSQKDRFLEHLREAVRAAPARVPYAAPRLRALPTIFASALRG